MMSSSCSSTLPRAQCTSSCCVCIPCYRCCTGRMQASTTSSFLHAHHMSSNRTALTCIFHLAAAAISAPILQATFLRGPVAGLGEDDASLAAELDALPDEDLEMRCRRSGLSKRGGRPAQISRWGGLIHSCRTGRCKLWSLPRAVACHSM